MAEYFPCLIEEGYEEKSLPTPRYNCMAFANDDERHWWQPGFYGGKYYWPQGVPQNDSLKAWTAVFTSDGYEITDNWELEADFEKVAIYIDFNGETSHVAKSDGFVWKSKLGKKQDIQHSKATSLEGEMYGVVERVLRRKKQ